MKCIKVFSSVDEAQLASSHLAGSGIRSFIRDANTVSTDWTLTNAVGGIRLEVEDSDIAAALVLLGVKVDKGTTNTPSWTEWLTSKRSNVVLTTIVLFLAAVVFGIIAWGSAK